MSSQEASLISNQACLSVHITWSQIQRRAKVTHLLPNGPNRFDTGLHRAAIITFERHIFKQTNGEKKSTTGEWSYLGDPTRLPSLWCASCRESSEPWRCRTSWSGSSHCYNTIRATVSSESCRQGREEEEGRKDGGEKKENAILSKGLVGWGRGVEQMAKNRADLIIITSGL